MTVATAPLRSPWATPIDARVRAAIDAHYESLWRFLRRMGVEERHVEDAAQQVLLVFAQRADAIAPAVVRAFLFGTALRIASDYRRKPEPALANPRGTPCRRRGLLQVALLKWYEISLFTQRRIGAL